MDISISKRVKLVKSLVIISVIGSLGSIYTEQKNLGDIYPFFTWKLYSQPLGTKRMVTNYRIYYTDLNTQKFSRLPVQKSKTFTTDEYIYTLNYLIKKTLEDSLNKNEYKNKLLVFIKHIAPHHETYKIVSESFDPMVLVRDKYLYDTATVITF